MTQSLQCHLPSTEYTIEIKPGLIEDVDYLAHHLTKLGSRFVIISDTSVAKLHGNKLQKALSAAKLDTLLLSFPSGEQHKTRNSKEELENQLFENQVGRDTCVIALGGGVVTDLGGFVAATYCRGLPLVMMPTSLLGMVDASIGGKTGVNVPYGKNLVGAIHQPKKVLIDPTVLQTLPIQEIRNGVVEMIKHGLILDQSYFSFLKQNADRILSLELSVLEKAIFDSCRIKKEVVEQDERESGKRHLLNFGHTIGHALEHLTRFSIPHGEAVAIGLLVESHLAVELGFLQKDVPEEIFRILKKFGLPLSLPEKFSMNQLLDAMTLDKKSQKGNPRFVMIDAIGSASVNF